MKKKDNTNETKNIVRSYVYTLKVGKDNGSYSTNENMTAERSTNTKKEN